MNYWLVKSEPFKYSWDQFVKDKRTYWDGVRNYQARNNLNAMKKDDAVLFYHSNEDLAVVGIARVVKEAYQDPTTEDQRWVVVDLEPIEPLSHPVPLSEMKQRIGNSNGLFPRLPLPACHPTAATAALTRVVRARQPPGAGGP
jgi:predicted RNA-binding protein with PUA-like domain